MHGQMSINYEDCFTTETCKRCGGSGFDPEHDTYMDGPNMPPEPDACHNCLGKGKEPDPELLRQYEDERFYRVFRL